MSDFDPNTPSGSEQQAVPSQVPPAAPHDPKPAEAPSGEPAPASGHASGAPAGGAETAGEGGDGSRRRRRRRRRRGGAEGGEGEAPVGDAPGPRPERRDRPDRGRPPQGRPGRGPRRPFDRGHHEHHALHAIKALSSMAQALLRVEGVDPLALPRFMELSLRVPLDPSIDARKAAGAAVEQILQRVREVREHEQALRPGAVFSYFEGSAAGDDCRPSEPRQVFDGYNSTGRPVFSDFVTMAIERKDPGIDQLLGGEDVVLTWVTMGRVLRTQQLAEFGGNSPVFKILGQVDAGLFRVLGAEQKCAFSFQLLRGSTLEGKPRLRLHAVGSVDLMDLADPSVLQLLSRFQRQLDAESLRLQGKEHNGEVDDEAFVKPLLQELAQQLSGRHKRQSRRTAHAIERVDEGQRPTPRAYPDAGEAGDASILYDTERNTIVVLGGKGRVHIFTPQARHVTSVMMQGSAVQNRRQQGRWRPAEPEERGEFRIQLKRLVAAGEDQPTPDPAPTPEPTPRPAAVAPPPAQIAPGEPPPAAAPEAASPEAAPTAPPGDDPTPPAPAAE